MSESLTVKGYAFTRRDDGQITVASPRGIVIDFFGGIMPVVNKPVGDRSLQDVADEWIDSWGPVEWEAL